ncbi:MAG: AAA family ATPase [Thermoprotei archaeon]
MFADEFVLFPDHTPIRLPHREHQLKAVISGFSNYSATGRAPPHVTLYGKVGTGKTAVSKLAARILAQQAKKAKINMGAVHINCHKVRTTHGALSEIAKMLSPFVITRGIPTSEIVDIIASKLLEEKTSLLVTLDEIDYLLGSAGDDLLYTLTRFGESYPSRSVGLILISRSLAFLDDLSHSVKSTMQKSFIEFPQYTAEQLFDILGDRVPSAFQPGRVSQDALNMVAQVSAQDGDARFALELLWKSGKVAESEKAPEVTADHVRTAFSGMVKSLALDALPNMGEHELLVLYAVCRRLKEEGAVFTTIGAMEKEYGYLCQLYGIEPRKHTQVWGYVKSLSSMGIILAQISGKGQRGKTTNLALTGSPLDPLLQEIGRQLRVRRIEPK